MVYIYQHNNRPGKKWPKPPVEKAKDKCVDISQFFVDYVPPAENREKEDK